MSSINDAVLRKTGGPTYNDGLATYYSKTTTESLKDAEIRWLVSQGATPGKSINDMWYEYLSGLGYTGSVSDMKLSFIRKGFLEINALSDNLLINLTDKLLVG